MSQATEKTNIVARYEIGLSNALKDAMQLHIDEMRLTREALVYQADVNDKLLAVMSAANDDKPELKKLGQWVFEALPENYISAAIDKGGDAYGYTCDLSILRPNQLGAGFKGDFDTACFRIGPGFDTTNWRQSAIARETVNDIDYLSNNDLDESVPHIDDVLSQPYWLSDSVPQITTADMQLIFIKNLSTVLIQRMHSMDRFSHDDYTIGGRGGDRLIPWDIVYDMASDRFGLITAVQKSRIGAFFLKPLSISPSDTAEACFHEGSLIGQSLRTITEDEIDNFRKVLEAYHA